ncbi:hypothetical protein [Glycomyces buryatensis]|uniref:Uncharacterized protein n=1 Tax=Glycomyces buryatensis TaxID=2570927 RepID=A0A4S8Q5E1_9ACTN|nr:hypothetical protein [Glycomyces buryatensis]THV38451.1 hypothetical protein FAB82_18545 [Glycomyces buryatensis]
MTQQTAHRPVTGRLAPTAAFLWSLLAIAIGLWHLVAPGEGPFSHELYQPTVPIPDSLPAFVIPTALMVAGAAGLMLARARAGLWPVTALYAIVFGLLVATSNLVAAAGYLAAFAIPLLVFVLPLLVARRPITRIVAFVAEAAALAALFAFGPVSIGVAAETFGNVARAFVDLAPHLLAQVWAGAGGVIWAALTVRTLRRRWTKLGAPAWLAPESAIRWGRAAAYIAAACALPYGLLRLTWLTPWPLLSPSPGELEADPGMRMWGLFLGFACLTGGVLCLGMTQRWGERWPVWMPGLHGKPVPPKIAIIPATTVAALFTIAGVSLPVMAIRQGEPLLALAFPFYIWGPALGAATLAYAIKRGVVQPLTN